MVAQVEPGETPAKVTPLVPYTKLPNVFVDELLGRVSSDAFALAVFVARHTIGYNGRTAADFTEPELAKALGLSLRSLQRAKVELRGVRVLEVSNGRGRGKTTAYSVTETKAWKVATKSANMADYSSDTTKSANMADNLAEPHGNRRGATYSANMADYSSGNNPPNMSLKPANMADYCADQNARVEPAEQAASSPAHASQKESYSNRKEKKETYMASPADSLPTKSSTSPTKTPKTPDPKADYTQALVTALQETMGAKIPNWALERKTAEWYYTAGKDGAPAPIADVMACWRAAKADEWWAGKYLGLVKLKDKWAVWVAPKPATGLARSAARSGARVAAAPPLRAPQMKTADMASPWE